MLLLVVHTKKICAFRLNIYLLKAKSHELFYIWVTKLQAHRLYKKNEAALVQSGFLHTLSHNTAAGPAHRNGDLVTIK